MSDFKYDEEGNLIGCPKCGARNMKKDGWQYWKTKKRQRWMCNACKKKTLNPKVLEKSPFKVDLEAIDDMPIDDIIAHRKRQFKHKTSAKESKTYKC